ncbi:pyridoxal kinase [Enemella dayhoffiae]|uniref:pyridoxal kinase n=1 Tax=Enemella dayhoffiae TaxID=2016507 RepID=A0A255H4Y1_9ACTN|nr:pyridoxal kinase PdxY [Enemella dayhoffiae]OYO22667.1 pyridoxal kinase [Enemella dayhoffiae]
MTTILSIQSSVAYGHAGNSAAVFPMQRRGVDVWPVHTVAFSNHTGYGAWRGPLLAASDVADIVTGIDERGVLDRVDAVLSGYQGGEEVGAVILEAVALVKQRNPSAIYCCDPVMGDVGRGFYARPGIPEFFRDKVVPHADVMTPNHFELNFLTGREASSLEEVLAAVDALRQRGPQTVLVTSVTHAGQQPGTLDMLAVDADGAWLVTTPLLDRTFTGSGDLTTAMFLTALLDGAGTPGALARTAAIVFGVLNRTAELGEAELRLVAAQDEIANPTRTFEVRQVR